MERFRYGQRIVIADPSHQFFRRKGTVVQVRASDGAGRVKIDGGLPPGESLILEGITYHDETVLMPGACERWGWV